MLSKDLTPNPKAVNIIRPFNPHHQQQQQQQHLFSNQFSPSQIIQRQPNFSSSTNSSSCTFSTASTTTTYNNHSTNNTNTSPMIRQPSSETSPGLSFFCQSSNNTITKTNISQNPFENMHQKQSQQQPPLVISRINVSNFNRRPTIQTDLDNGITTLDNAEEEEDDDDENDDVVEDDDEVDDIDDIDVAIDDIDDNDDLQIDDVVTTTEEESNQTNHRLPSSFTPGFGIMSGGLGSFLLRGTMQAQAKPQPADDARVHRKIEDLEIEKKSLLTLNQTLETVVKEQSTTISDLQNRLASIERPLTPGLDTSSSKNGIMSSPDILESTDLERYLEDEDAAFERIRLMLLELIEQAQSAVTQTKKVSGRVITDIDGQYRNINMKRSDTIPHGRPRSVIGDRSSTIKNSTQQKVSRRISLGSINNASTTTTTSIHINNNSNNLRRLSSSPTFYNTKPHSSPSTSPIPNRRYSMQRSVSRSSSPATLNTNPGGNSKQQPATKASKYINHKHKTTTTQDSQTRKWLN